MSDSEASRSRIRRTPILLAALLVGLLAGPVAAGQQAQQEMPPLEVQPGEFSWVEVDQESGQATYEWSATVENGDTQGHEVDVVLQLLDDQDTVQHEETVRVELDSEGTEQVQSSGSVDVATAQTVTQLRHQLRLVN